MTYIDFIYLLSMSLLHLMKFKVLKNMLNLLDKLSFAKRYHIGKMGSYV